MEGPVANTRKPPPVLPSRQSRRRRRALVALADDEYVLLDDVAERESRTADQQATHVVRRWLRQLAATGAARGGADDAGC